MSQENTTKCQACRKASCFGCCLQGAMNDPGQEVPLTQGHEAPSAQGRTNKPPATGGWAARRQYLGGLLRNAFINRSNEEETPNASAQGEPSPGTSTQPEEREDSKKKGGWGRTILEGARELFSIRPRVAPVYDVPGGESPNTTEAHMGATINEEQEAIIKVPSEQPESNCSSDYDDDDVGGEVPRPEDNPFFVRV